MSIFGLSCITHICYMQLHKRTPADVPVSELVYFFMMISDSLRFGT